MADPETRRDSNARVQIIIALIGLAGVIATALISNWSHIFSHKAPNIAPTATSPGTQASSGKKPDRPPQGPEHSVHSSGRKAIRATYLYDLDTGTEQPAGADLWWEHKTMEIWFLTPQNGAAFYVVGPREFEAVRWSELEHFPYSIEKINATRGPSNLIPAGTVVAYRTNEGRLGKLIVDDYGFNLTIRWRTYD